MQFVKCSYRSHVKCCYHNKIKLYIIIYIQLDIHIIYIWYILYVCMYIFSMEKVIQRFLPVFLFILILNYLPLHTLHNLAKICKMQILHILYKICTNYWHHLETTKTSLRGNQNLFVITFIYFNKFNIHIYSIKILN